MHRHGAGGSVVERLPRRCTADFVPIDDHSAGGFEEISTAITRIVRGRIRGIRFGLDVRNRAIGPEIIEIVTSVPDRPPAMQPTHVRESQDRGPLKGVGLRHPQLYTAGIAHHLLHSASSPPAPSAVLE